MTSLFAPFPWFGGKRKVSHIVWHYFGDVDHYVEPFAGSLAVLLGRPAEHLAAGRRRMETVNDKDMYIANFWRAVKSAPDEVAYYADWPVNEADLTARHLWLVNEGRARLQRLMADPDDYDPKIAGWWVWGISCWIGDKWCLVKDASPEAEDDDDENNEVHAIAQGESEAIRGRPHTGYRNGVHQISLGGVQVHVKRPGLGYQRDINAVVGQIPEINHSKGIHSRRAGDLYRYMQALADRLRHVVVCCGDWTRVLTHGALAHGNAVGVFLDPPYAHDVGRDTAIYNHDEDISDSVREWALAHGDDPRFRIALCGYEGEHDMPPSWHVVAWNAGSSYKSSKGDTKGNGRRERIWFSPHCLIDQLSLW